MPIRRNQSNQRINTMEDPKIIYEKLLLRETFLENKRKRQLLQETINENLIMQTKKKKLLLPLDTKSK